MYTRQCFHHVTLCRRLRLLPNLLRPLITLLQPLRVHIRKLCGLLRARPPRQVHHSQRHRRISLRTHGVVIPAPPVRIQPLRYLRSRILVHQDSTSNSPTAPTSNLSYFLKSFLKSANGSVGSLSPDKYTVGSMISRVDRGGFLKTPAYAFSLPTRESNSASKSKPYR